MGKLTATAYDRWWRSRIEREETEYALHVVKNKQPIMKLNTLGAPQLVDLPSTTGMAAPKPAALAAQQAKASSSSSRNSAVAATLSAQAPPAAHGPVQHREQQHAAANQHQQAQASGRQHHQQQPHQQHHGQQRHVQLPSKPATPSLLKQALVQQQALSKAGDAAAGKSRGPRSVTSAGSSRASSRPSTSGRGSQLSSVNKAADVEGGSVASGFATPKSAYYPRTPNFSDVSASDSEIMTRLARLEADLADERLRREAAEAEMRTLLASRGGAA